MNFKIQWENDEIFVNELCWKFGKGPNMTTWNNLIKTKNIEEKVSLVTKEEPPNKYLFPKPQVAAQN